MELFIFTLTRMILLGCTYVIFREALTEVRGAPVRIKIRINLKAIKIPKEWRELPFFIPLGRILGFGQQ